MSKENVQKFYEALAQDAELAKELDARIAAATFAFAAEKGFEFTAKDLTEDLAELSDEDLDQVNGGDWIITFNERLQKKEQEERAKADILIDAYKYRDNTQDDPNPFLAYHKWRRL